MQDFLQTRELAFPEGIRANACRYRAGPDVGKSLEILENQLVYTFLFITQSCFIKQAFRYITR